jgi:hypothetical protein
MFRKWVKENELSGSWRGQWRRALSLKPRMEVTRRESRRGCEYNINMDRRYEQDVTDVGSSDGLLGTPSWSLGFTLKAGNFLTRAPGSEVVCPVQLVIGRRNCDVMCVFNSLDVLHDD